MEWAYFQQIVTLLLGRMAVFQVLDDRIEFTIETETFTYILVSLQKSLRKSIKLLILFAKKQERIKMLSKAQSSKRLN